MKLHIEFDEDLMRDYDRRGASPFFTIYWMHSQAAYPEEGWMDFGAVVLGWWLVTAKQITEGAQEGELTFMDGPFRMKIWSVGDDLSVSAADLDQPWQVAQETFVNELLAGAKRVQRKLQELGLADREGLKVGVTRLENAIAAQQRQKHVGAAQKQYAA
ncbi:MAG: hypothetical protein JO250_14925 [Armatimonadetes bacterium]|nr:hypothetical protein [Armatimonadota bacterium]